MGEYLPYREFEWLKNVDSFDVMSIDKKIDVGYILEVDLKYPNKLHELHNHYPLAPEKLLLMIYFQTIVKVLLINMI